MPAPFYNAIKGTTAGTPGTGAFTPNAAASGFRAWSVVPAGWIGLVRYEDGTAWELTWSYWNGTTLSRSSTQLFDSSSGSQISLTSAATAAMVESASDIMSHLGTTSWRGWIANNGGAPTALGVNVPTALGTNSGPSIASTNFLTEQVRSKYTSATTVNAQAGLSASAVSPIAISSSTAGRGGWEFTSRFGASTLPTGPRLFVGLSSVTLNASTVEPSTLTGHIAAFALDSTDTNIQLLVNSNAGGGTKTDTGIPLAANGWYEISIWTDQGSTTVHALLIRLDTGAIWYGTTSTDVPTGAMAQHVVGGLNGTNTGTAFVLELGSAITRNGC